MDVWFAIATGVVGGVVTAGLLFVTRTLVIGHLLPWYHDLVYRGINVDGVWFASDFWMSQDIRININQRAGAISGDAQFSRRHEERDRDLEDLRVFNIDGRIQDRYVTLTLSHTNRQRIGVVTFLLEPVCDGRQLKGAMSFVSIVNNSLESIPVHFARDAAVVIAERQVLEEESEEQIADLIAQPELPLLLKTPRKRNKRQLEPATPSEDIEKIVIE